jgi:hypothetical protein
MSRVSLLMRISAHFFSNIRALGLAASQKGPIKRDYSD